MTLDKQPRGLSPQEIAAFSQKADQVGRATTVILRVGGEIIVPDANVQKTTEPELLHSRGQKQKS